MDVPTATPGQDVAARLQLDALPAGGRPLRLQPCSALRNEGVMVSPPHPTARTPIRSFLLDISVIFGDSGALLSDTSLSFAPDCRLFLQDGIKWLLQQYK